MTPPLHLLVNGRFLTRPLSGVDRVAVELVRAIASLGRSRGLGMTMSLAVPGNFRDQHLAPLADVHFASIVRGRLKGQAWEQIELRSIGPEAMLLNLCNMGPLLRHRQFTLIHDAQVILEPNSYSHAFRAWYRLAQPVLARRSMVVATVSNYSRRELERFGVVPRGKAAVIHNGVDHFGRITPDPLALDRFALTPGNYILALGNLAPHKNLAMLMRAAAARPDGEPELVVAGGANAKVFQDAGLASPPGVRMLGRVTDAELRALYGGARFFAFPSLTEGFGLPPLEAMSCGCPVIATSAAAVPEVCGRAAWLIDPRDEAAWTRTMIILGNDRTRLADLVRRGERQFRLFTWAAAAERLLGLVGVDVLCDQPGPPDHLRANEDL